MRPQWNIPVWETADWTPLPRLDHDTGADACVIGLGSAGLSCALALLSAGQRVVGVDAGQIGGGAAGRNGGFLLAGTARFHHDAVAAYGRSRACAMYRLTLDELDRTFVELPLPDVARRTGSLRIAGSEGELADCEHQLEQMRADGLPAEPYSGPEGRGLLIPSDGVFQPLTRCRELARRALAAGAKLFEHSRATIGPAGEVLSGGAHIRCDRVFVAIDGGISRVLPELAPDLRPARLQMLATAPASEVRFPRPVYSRYGYDYWQQTADGRVAIGGFRDLGGAMEWTTDPVPSTEVQAAIEQFLRDTLHVTAEITHRWAAVVGYTRNGLPIARRVRDNVWAVGGYSGTGNIIGTLLGRGIVGWALHGDDSIVSAFHDVAE